MKHLLLFLLAACLLCSGAAGVTITDDYGTTVRISETPERIVSLSPANTEILFALGLGEKVVGVTDYCTYPEAALEKDKVGGYSSINIEKVVALNPDLIIASDGNSEETVNHLRELGFTVIMLNADTIENTIHAILLIGEATGAEEEAKRLTESIETGLAETAEKTAGLEKPTILHCMWTDPLWVSGSGTFQDEMITAAGGVNAAASESGWVSLTMEKFLTMNPDIIVVDSGNGMGVGADDALRDFFLTDPRMQHLTAVQNGDVYVVNADIIDRGGPRILEGVEALAKIAHPEEFGEYEDDSSAASSPGFSVIGVLAGIGVLALRRR